MKRKAVFVSIFMAMTIFCVSCGTRLPEAGDYTAKDSASEGAVKAEKKERKYDRFPFCNEDNYYRITDTKLVQGGPDGAIINKFPLKDAKNIKIWRVNNKEILYVKDKCELWRIPIKKDADGAVPQVDGAEKILTDKDEIWDVYANDDYIIYESGVWYGAYNEYDRREKKRIPVDRAGKKKFIPYTGANILDVIGGDYIMLGEAIENDDVVDLVSKGGYIHKIGSGQVTKIDDRCMRLSHPYLAFAKSSKASGEKFFFGNFWSWDESKDEYVEDGRDVWMYDALTGKKEICISEEQFIQCIKKNKISFNEDVLHIGEIFIDNGRIYVEGNTYSSSFMVSRELEGDSELQYDEKLSRFLDEEINIYRVMGMDIIDGKFLVTGEEMGEVDKTMMKCYDIAKGTYKDVKEGDRELVYWHMGVGWE